MKPHRVCRALRMKGLYLLITCSGVLLAGCGLAFDLRFDRVAQGMDSTAVLDLLGTPPYHDRFTLAMGWFGPREGLYGTVELGTEVEEWSWRVGGTDGTRYHVFFGPDGRVFEKAAYPADAVF